MKTAFLKHFLACQLLLFFSVAYAQTQELNHFELSSRNLKFDMPADIFVSKADDNFVEYSNRLGTFRIKFIDENLPTLQEQRSKLYELIKIDYSEFDESKDNSFVDGKSAGGFLMVTTTVVTEYADEEAMYILFTDPKNPKNNVFIISTYDTPAGDDNPGYKQAITVLKSFSPINK